MELQGQVALVTGGSRGIGRGCVLALAQGGAAVVVGYKERADLAQAVVAEVEANGGQALALQVDVANPQACTALVDAAVAQFGRLDILVNNAGTALEKLLIDTDVAEWDELMAIHLRGMFACSRAALQPMAAQGYGRIINMSSIWGIRGAAGEVAYSTAKAGQIGFTKALAQEVGPWGITVNAVAPGAIQTDMTAVELEGGYLEEWLQRSPVGRLGTAAEIGALVRFLVGPHGGFVTGQVWSPNGGVVI